MLGDNIKKTRLQNKVSQQKLAAYLNLSQQAVAKWEKGISEPDSATLVKLANYFHVSVDYLLNRENTSDDNEIQFSSRHMVSIGRGGTREEYEIDEADEAIIKAFLVKFKKDQNKG